MSAICAVWAFHDHPPANLLSETMLGALAPHGQVRRSAKAPGGVSLGCLLDGHLPEDRFDRQLLPQRNGSTCYLAADLRLDNRADLVTRLQLTQPETLADSAILLAAWSKWGEACVDYLVGAFAFIVWSPERRVLFAARDHTGERPLYFYRGPQFVALASMPKGLRALPEIPAEFNERRILSYLGLGGHGARETFFAHIERLPAGHTLRITPHETVCRPYWHPSDSRPTRYRNPDDYGEALVEVLDRATAARMRHTGGVGATLSAGLDSSSVTASAATLLSAQGGRLTAFTSVPRPDFNGTVGRSSFADEGPAAALVAELYPNIDHVLVHSRGRNLLDDVQQMTDAADEPVSSVANQPWLAEIFAQAQMRGIGVLLNGQMGNATISYDGTLALRDLFRQGRWLRLAGRAFALRRNHECSIKELARISLDGLLPRPALQYLQPFDPTAESQVSILQRDLAHRHQVEKVRQKLHFANLGSTHASQRKTFDVVDLGAANAAFPAFSGVDFRDPTADKCVFELCYSIPPEHYLSLGRPRSLVRRGMRARLPADTLTRYKWGRQGADWNLTVEDAMPALRRELRAMRQSPAASRILDLAYLSNLLEEWPTGDFNTSGTYQVWNYNLCRGIALGYFLRSQEKVQQSAAHHTEPAAVTAAC